MGSDCCSSWSLPITLLYMAYVVQALVLQKSRKRIVLCLIVLSCNEIAALLVVTCTGICSVHTVFTVPFGAIVRL